MKKLSLTVTSTAAALLIALASAGPAQARCSATGYDAAPGGATVMCGGGSGGSGGIGCTTRPCR